MTAPELELGDLLVLRQSGVENGPAFRARIRELARDVIAVRSPDCSFKPGEALRVELVIPNDARYILEVQLRSDHNELLSLVPMGEWIRLQRREYFRIRTAMIPVKILRARHLRGPKDDRIKSTLYDMSAGGAQIETILPLKVDEELRISFELPGDPPGFVLSEDEEESNAVAVEVVARVIRTVQVSRGRTKRVGVRFVAIVPSLRSDILRWVYSLQAKRRAREIDASFDDF